MLLDELHEFQQVFGYRFYKNCCGNAVNNKYKKC